MSGHHTISDGDRSNRADSFGSQTTKRARYGPMRYLKQVARHNRLEPAESFILHVENAVCARTGEKFPLGGRSQIRPRSRARQILALICRHSLEKPISYGAVGRALSRDHTTIRACAIHGAEIYVRDAGFASTLNYVEEDLIDDGWDICGAAYGISAYFESLRAQSKHGWKI